MYVYIYIYIHIIYIYIYICIHMCTQVLWFTVVSLNAHHTTINRHSTTAIREHDGRPDPKSIQASRPKQTYCLNYVLSYFLKLCFSIFSLKPFLKNITNPTCLSLLRQWLPPERPSSRPLLVRRSWHLY